MSTVVATPATASASRGGGFWRAPALIGSFLVGLTVALANAVFLLGIRSSNPMMYYSGLGSPDRGNIRGAWTIDPNVGWTVQSLGRAAAHSWARGHVPLWNSYEGLGQPLAGEMQSAALFQPFIMLQLLPNGVFVMHLALELVAGVTTLFFLRRLGLGWVAATVGGCLFAVNGAFAVMTNAPFNPIAFLPMALWGVETILSSVRIDREDRDARPRPWAGVAILGLALGWMLLAGFPETALLEGLFIAAWALLRLVQMPGCRRLFIAWMVAGLTLGLALAAPVLVSFVDFMKWATTGYHEGIANDYSYPTRQIMSLALPYATGGLSNPVMMLQAGYVTLPAVMLALVGLTSARRRGAAALLALTMVVITGNMFGFGPIKTVLNHTPGIKSVLVYKYGLSILEFAVVIAAAIGVDDLARRRVGRLRALGCASVVAGYAVITLIVLRRNGYITNTRWTVVVVSTLVLVCVVLLALLLLARPPRLAAVAAGALLVLTGIGHFLVPQGSASATVPVDTAPITYLKQHLGTSRFYTLGPIQPDYGSYWGLAQFNTNDLPVPQKYGDLVMQQLRPAGSGLTKKQLGDTFRIYQLVPFNPSAAVQRKLLVGYGERQQVFRDAGVRYLVARPGVVDASSAARLGLHKVLTSRKTEIFEDAHASDYYTSDGGCTVANVSRTELTVTCPKAATLTRRELNAPGWSATIGGSRHTVDSDDHTLYQSITVPSGTSHITFDYRPKHFTLSVATCGAGLVALVACLLTAVLHRPRGTRRHVRSVSAASPAAHAIRP